MPTTTAETLALSNTTVIVHPLVLLSVADHAARSATGARKRSVGVLLGQDNGSIVNVANSFAVPFEEDDNDPKTWFLDHNYILGMNDMFKKVNAKEKMIGWYHTGPRLRSSDLEINELLKRIIPRPVMVIINPRQREAGLPTNAYFAMEDIKDDGTTTEATFMHVPSEIQAEEAEEIGVEHLLRDVRDTTSVGTLSTRVEDRLAGLRGLQARLLEIRDYLQDVVAGKLPVNHQIIYNLQDIFNLLPNLDLPPLKRALTAANNDQLLVVYLSSLIRSVIALHGLVDNRMDNARGDEDDADAQAAPAEEEASAAAADKDQADGKDKPKDSDKSESK